MILNFFCRNAKRERVMAATVARAVATIVEVRPVSRFDWKACETRSVRRDIL